MITRITIDEVISRYEMFGSIEKIPIKSVNTNWQRIWCSSSHDYEPETISQLEPEIIHSGTGNIYSGHSKVVANNFQ